MLSGRGIDLFRNLRGTSLGHYSGEMVDSTSPSYGELERDHGSTPISLVVCLDPADW